MTLRHSLILVCFLMFSSTIIAQYEEDRKYFNYKDYKRSPVDKYEPLVAAAAASLFPGLGHFYCDERERGVKFFKRTVVGFTISAVGLVYVVASDAVNFGYGMLIGGMVLVTANQIWSIVDAIRVSKVKNMALRRQGK